MAVVTVTATEGPKSILNSKLSLSLIYIIHPLKKTDVPPPSEGQRIPRHTLLPLPKYFKHQHFLCSNCTDWALQAPLRPHVMNQRVAASTCHHHADRSVRQRMQARRPPTVRHHMLPPSLSCRGWPGGSELEEHGWVGSAGAGSYAIL